MYNLVAVTLGDLLRDRQYMNYGCMSTLCQIGHCYYACPILVSLNWYECGEIPRGISVDRE